MTDATHTYVHAQDALGIASSVWSLDQIAEANDWAGVCLSHEVVHHRDSGCLAESNWAVVTEDMQDRFGDSAGEACFGHFGYGWVEHLACDVGDLDAVRALIDWDDRLADYHIADEDDWSQRQFDELQTTLTDGYDIDSADVEAVIGWLDETDPEYVTQRSVDRACEKAGVFADIDYDRCHGIDGVVYRVKPIYGDRNDVVVIAVGDDYERRVSADDLTPLGDDDFCAECGQMGCKACG